MNYVHNTWTPEVIGDAGSVCLLSMVVIPSLLWYLLVGTGLGGGTKMKNESKFHATKIYNN